TASFSACDVFPQDGRGVPGSGVLAPVSGARAEKGAMIIDATVQAIAAQLKELFVLEKPTPQDRQAGEPA
ncbi:MAG: hypothetical protein SVR81_09360, partial [Chloroflexota bacterium]|nr:hypothetical protein [Chloroflexota bacterium]